ncbi:MAG: hypothetical protein U9Q40_04035 [Campylobacterota bacterium]|nr:hypothetical protein [Campylobacterota bacterium]
MTKIKVVGLLVFALSILLVILFKHVSEQSKTSNTLLDTINQQKAFTQEISKNIFYIYKNKNASSSQLDNSIKSFISNMNSRDQKLDSVDSIAIKEQSSKIISLWNSFYLEVQNFRDASKITTSYSSIILEKLVNKIYNLNLELVVEFDALINIHQSELEDRISVYKDIQYFLFFLLLALLIYLFTQIKEIMLFIQKFSATSKKIISNASIKDLEPLKAHDNSTNTQISNATDNFNVFIEKINDSIEHSSGSIKHSCQSLDVVESNIENLFELLYEMEENKTIDKELTKKEDIIIQTLEELSSATQNLKELKIDLDNLTSHISKK